MKTSIEVSAALIGAVLGLSMLPVVVHADTTTGGSKLTAQQKSASDALMASGLTNLQSASSDLQSGDEADALTCLRTAYTDMSQASPIYHGYRVKSMKETKECGLALDRNKKRSLSRASTLLGDAIGSAQTALQDG